MCITSTGDPLSGTCYDGLCTHWLGKLRLVCVLIDQTSHAWFIHLSSGHLATGLYWELSTYYVRNFHTTVFQVHNLQGIGEWRWWDGFALLPNRSCLGNDTSHMDYATVLCNRGQSTYACIFTPNLKQYRFAARLAHIHNPHLQGNTVLRSRVRARACVHVCVCLA